MPRGVLGNFPCTKAGAIFGGQNLEFRYFLGFSEKMNIFWVGNFCVYFLGVQYKLNIFWCLMSEKGLC